MDKTAFTDIFHSGHVVSQQISTPHLEMIEFRTTAGNLSIPLHNHRNSKSISSVRKS